MREHRGDRDRESRYDAGQGGGARDLARERTSEDTATARAYRLRQEAESAVARAKNLPAIVQRDEWRIERANLQQAHAELSRQLDEGSTDARVSERAKQYRAAAARELGEMAAALANAEEPRALPPVQSEEAIEPRIVDRSIPADEVLAWVSELGSRERGALVERIRHVQDSADRSDAFSVALANYLAAKRIASQFFGVAENPRRFDRAAYERARARAGAADAPAGKGARDASPTATDTRAGAHPAPPAVGLDTGDQAAISPPLPFAPTSGQAPSELPYRAEMERSFGRPLDHVQAYTGVGHELAPYDARALATGNVVVFADASPSRALVAHEVTHTVQNQQAGAAAAMASGVVAPHDSPAEAEADAIAGLVAAHGTGVRLPPITAAPAAHVQLAPKLLVPDPDLSPHPTILVPDANHPARRDLDGDQVIQTGTTTASGKPTPLRGTSWKSLAEVAESVHVQDDSGDTLHIDITYRLESRPAEVGEVPDIWIHAERKALLTIGTGEHAGATIVGQARIYLAPGEARDPKAAVGKLSIGADHWAQIYLAEAGQYVNLHGPGGRASLRADAADNDVLAYNDPLRTLVGLKNLLKQQHVAGHGRDVAQAHVRAQRLLANAKLGRGVLEREIASIRSHHDPHPGRVASVRFLVGDITEWLAVNQQAGRDGTEDAHQLRKARVELEQRIADAENAHAPKRDQLDDALRAPVRFFERTAEGMKEVGAMAVDAVVLGVDAIGEATGIGTFDYHPISKYGQSIEATGASATTALVTMVNGFADEWSDAIERAKHGDYRGVTDVGIDTLLLIDGARTSGVIALDKAEVVAAKLGNVAKSARAVVQSASASASAAPTEVRNIAAAMADGAEAFLTRLRAGGMQMAAAAGGGGRGPSLGELSAETLAEAAQAAKEAFKDKRLAQHAPKHGENAAAHTDAAKSPGSAQPTESAPQPDATTAQAVAEKTAKEAQRTAKSAAGNAETNAIKKYQFEASEKSVIEKKTRDAAVEAAEKAYKDAIAAGETPAQANTAANKAAKDAAENVAKAAAQRAAKEAAERAIASGGAFEPAKLNATVQRQLADFNAGKAGAEAKRLARELDGLNENDFLAKMAGEPCTSKTVNISGPPPQVMRVYEYPDGTVVRYKPDGGSKRPGPTYSIEMKKDPSWPDLGQDDAAFKIDPFGRAVPKGPFDLKNPYPKGSVQALRFERTVMDAGHKTLEVRQ
jgi:hypothetical protein